jgi:hypothetical protein
MMHPRGQRARLRLEVLEDRSVPASLPPPNLLVTNVEAQSALAEASVSFPPAPIALSATTPPGDQVVSGPPAVPTLPNLPSPDVDALGFTGRFVFPGTGVQSLVANGDGPLTQPPGLYLLGGGAQPEEPGGPAAAVQGAGDGEAGGADDGLVPDGVWDGTDWLEQMTVLHG